MLFQNAADKCAMGKCVMLSRTLQGGRTTEKISNGRKKVVGDGRTTGNDVEGVTAMLKGRINEPAATPSF